MSLKKLLSLFFFFALLSSGCAAKKGIIFKERSISSDDKAKILNLSLIEETEDKLILDVEYYLSKKVDGIVYIGVYPNIKYWSVSRTLAQPGKHKATLSVGLDHSRANSIEESSNLRLSMKWYKDKQYKGQLFKRIIPYNKVWKSPISQNISLDNQIDNIAHQIINNLTLKKKSTIAVIAFSDLKGNVNGFGNFLSEELITRLFKNKQFNIIERQLLKKIVDEHKLGVSGMIDENTAKEFGSILGVDAIVTGSITDLGRSIKVNARLIATDTGTIFAVASGEIIKDDKMLTLMNDDTKSSKSASD